MRFFEQPSAQVGLSRAERANHDFARRAAQRSFGETLLAYQPGHLRHQKDPHIGPIAQGTIPQIAACCEVFRCGIPDAKSPPGGR